MAGVEYQVTKVDPTDPETKGMVYQVHKVSEEVAATLGGKVYRARIIKDPTEPTVIGKVYQVVFIDDPDDPSVKGKVYNAIVVGGSQVVVIGPAVSPLVLPDAIAGDLVSLKAFGGCEQVDPLDPTAVPTPDAPIDIVCNNGVIKYGQYSNNIFNKNDTDNIGNWLSSASYKIATAASNVTLVMRAKPGATYYYKHCSVTGGGRAFYTEVEDWDVGSDCSTMSGSAIIDKNNVRSITVSENAKWVFFIYGRSNQTATFEEQLADYMVSLTPLTSNTPYEPYRFGIHADGTVETINVHGKNLFDNATITTSYRLTDTGTITSETYGFYTAHIPVIAGSTYTYYQSTGSGVILRICEYDSSNTLIKLNKFSSVGTQTQTITMQSNTSYVIISGDNRFVSDPPQFERGTSVSTYEPYFNGGTATCEDLLSVGDYTDQQEVISGAVTRKVGVKVFDGTENWIASGPGWYTSIRDKEPRKIEISCTHYPYSSAIMANAPDKSIVSFASVNIGFKDSAFTSADAVKAFCLQQYNAGTPVIVVYPLDEPTTETVTGQTLQVTDGDNVVEITQASLDGLELEVTYEKEAE